MKVSTNQSAKRNFSKGINNPTKTFNRSTHIATRTNFQKSANAVSGENLASSPFGSEDIFGGPFSSFGQGEFGGISHFKLRTPYFHSH